MIFAALPLMLLSIIALPWYITTALAVMVAPLRYSLVLLAGAGIVMDSIYGVGSGMPYLYSSIFTGAGLVALVLRTRALN